jgi:hypothetical protein
MRSPDSAAGGRIALEVLLRAASILLLAWLLWLSLDRRRAYQVTSARSADLARAVREWTAAPRAPDAIHVLLDATPAPLERDWLAAVGAAGSVVTWSGSPPPVGLDVQALATPRGGSTVLVAAPRGARLVVSDQVGVLDSAVAGDAGARFTIPAATDVIEVRAAGSRARALVPEPRRIRGVLVVGEAGWESKFVAAALEEDGWAVELDLRVAPGVSVTQGAAGAAGAVDTSRHAAVIALDASVAPRAAQLARYVTDGGGLILLGSAASVDALAPLRAGAIGRIVPPPVGVSRSGPTTLASLSAAPLTGLADDAVVLERRGAAVVAAARRHAAGRVLQMGHQDVWRWRMSGGETSVADHRAWWSRAVAGVAYAPAGAVPPSSNGRTPDRTGDQAPVAAVIAALGPGSAGAVVVGDPVTARVPAAWLFALLALTLLAEWGSRRARGER